MIFKIHALQSDDKQTERTFFYDNMKNVLSDSDGNIYEYTDESIEIDTPKEYTSFSPKNPLSKSKKINILKIQLGLSCNYSCTYCSQRFVSRPEETTKDNIDNFMSMLDNLELSESDGLKIELWGGEPFVYWKTLKPLVHALKQKFASWKKKPFYSIITNGSLLNDEINYWILKNIDSVSISHDGPGQSVRGPDPFDDPEQREAILDLYRMKKGSISFNSMLNAKNMSRKEIHNWFVNLTGDDYVTLGEGGVVDAYDEGGLELSLLTKADHFKFRQTAFNDMYSTDGQIGFSGIKEKVNEFVTRVLLHADAKYLSQKCGMDSENVIAVDLNGNVITCQNVSAVSINSNGESHLSGSITDMDSVRVTTSTHWSNREHCSNCPVLHICKGSCMFVTGEYWEKSCANAYSDAVALFALAFEKITGCVPVFIDDDKLPDVRKDIWGTVLKHEEEQSPKKFPIKVVAEKV